MQIRLADYVADFLVKKGIKDCFMVTGGGAMHLNDALGHKEGLHCTYNHHEQACAIAAEAYARVDNRIAAVCVTTGPGGTNAITGVVGGWLDSVPMLVISGQVRYDTTARYMAQFTEGYPLRAVGDQEYDIVKSVEPMCKFATMIEDPRDIRYALEKGYYLAMTGRRGPSWIDIPVNFQGAIIETDELKGFEPEKEGYTNGSLSNDKSCAYGFEPKSDEIDKVIELIRKAKRPVLYAGNGIRLSEGYDEFRKSLEILNIPVVTCWDSIDAIEDANPLYTGRGGIMGDRAGNFAVQNADLVLAVGNRLSIRQVGYSWKTWAREAKVIVVDIDPAELRKTTLHVDLPICADAKEFFKALNAKLSGASACDEDAALERGGWLEQCQLWKKNYPVTQDKHWEENGDTANVYAFVKYLSSKLPDNNMTVVSNGSACVVGSHNYEIKKDSRFLINSAVASMGYGLPAAIGACIAFDRKTTICLEGDGSIMMNLQELQTVLTNKLPIKIFLINNEGYHSIRQTQTNLFGEHTKVGIGPESGDLSFPNFGKIATAFGYKYIEARSNISMKDAVDQALATEGPVFVEIFVSKNQNFEPKSSTKRLPDGTLVSPPLEDLAPFLPREEVEKNMYIDMIEE